MCQVYICALRAERGFLSKWRKQPNLEETFADNYPRHDFFAYPLAVCRTNSLVLLGDHVTFVESNRNSGPSLDHICYSLCFGCISKCSPATA